ncbi:MAG TPA: ferritin-like domain-containing protein [Ignavibacteriaceae bacterium]|nr:ferritin-like domain-containing protein [Ignavibacteriaceae bacterium]
MGTLKDLFVEELKDLYHAEKQITKALPQMAKKASSDQLREAFESHLKETENQISRLEKVFKELDMAPKGKKCEAMEGIIQEGKTMMQEFDKSETLDAALIAAAQKVEHYEMASYGTVRTYAQQLNFKNAADLLQETLEEESAANEKLNDLAINQVNAEAVSSSKDEEE